MIAQRDVERGDHAVGDAGPAHLHEGLEPVREAAQMAAVARPTRSFSFLHGRANRITERRGPLLAGRVGLYGAIWSGRDADLWLSIVDHTTVAARASSVDEWRAPARSATRASDTFWPRGASVTPPLHFVAGIN